MRIVGIAFVAGLLAAPALAAPAIYLQDGIVCNSVAALHAFQREQWRAEDGPTLRKIARDISTRTDWCIEGYVRESRPTQEMPDDTIPMLELLDLLMGSLGHKAIPPGVIDSMMDLVPKTYSYKTERGATMYFVANPEPKKAE